MTLLYIYILWVAACVDSISAVPLFTVSARVGSTVVLPCKLNNVFNERSRIQWSTNYNTVFKRGFYGMTVGSEYEDRVEIPEDELERKRNCSLVLKNVRVTDGGLYESTVLEPLKIGHFYRERIISKVELSVHVFWNISAEVGSTVILPCEWRNLTNYAPHVKWRIDSETVFERKGEESFPGEGYEGRVDVPEDELLKGNCSLVLKNFSATDAAVYRSSLVVTHTEKPVLVQTVKLSVYGEAGINCPRPLILIISLLMCLVFSLLMGRS